MEVSGDKWKWFEMNKNEDHKDFRLYLKEYSQCESWLNNIQSKGTNYLEIGTAAVPFISGALIYNQQTAEQEDYEIFHFYLTNDFLVTQDLNFKVLESTREDYFKEEIEKTQSPIDGFLLILGEIVKNYLHNIDEFEIRLNNLLWEMKKENNINTLEKMHQSRHEILIWKHLMIPVKEIEKGLEEAFGEEILESKVGKRIVKRFERALGLLSEYQQEITAMVDFEQVVSAHRGNEIMKTLTVITTLVCPFGALGALWGMNFKIMPELNWKYGYLIALITIFGSSGALLLYLRMKGWTGDLLKGNKNRSFFK